MHFPMGTRRHRHLTGNVLSEIQIQTLYTHRRWRRSKLVLFYEMIAWSCMHTKFALNQITGYWDTKQREIWTLPFICIAKIASYQLDDIMWYDCLITLHMHTKSGLSRSRGCWDTTQREIWTLTFICIARWPKINLVLCNMIGKSHYICMPNLGSIGTVVSEIQNKGNVCVGVCGYVCVLIYEDGSGLTKEHKYSHHPNHCMIIGTWNVVLVVKFTLEDSHTCMVTHLRKAAWYEQRKTRRIYAKVLQCSKLPESCSPLFRMWFRAIWNFDARACARRDAHRDMDC